MSPLQDGAGEAAVPVLTIAELLEERFVFCGNDVEHRAEGAIHLHHIPDPSVEELPAIVADNSAVTVHACMELFERAGFSAEVLRNKHRGFFPRNNRPFNAVCRKRATEPCCITDDENIFVCDC